MLVVWWQTGVSVSRWLSVLMVPWILFFTQNLYFYVIFFLFSRVCTSLVRNFKLTLTYISLLQFLSLHYHTLPSIICMAQVGIPTFTFWQDTSGGSLLSTMAKSLVSVDASRKAGPGCFGCRGWGCRGQQAALEAGVEAVAWLPSPSQLGQV